MCMEVSRSEEEMISYDFLHTFGLHWQLTDDILMSRYDEKMYNNSMAQSSNQTSFD